MVGAPRKEVPGTVGAWCAGVCWKCTRASGGVSIRPIGVSLYVCHLIGLWDAQGPLPVPGRPHSREHAQVPMARVFDSPEDDAQRVDGSSCTSQQSLLRTDLLGGKGLPQELPWPTMGAGRSWARPTPLRGTLSHLLRPGRGTSSPQTTGGRRSHVVWP